MRAAMARTSRTSQSYNDDCDVLDSPSDIEVGTLAISINSNMNTIELRQRPILRPILHGDGKNALTFEIPVARVMPPETEKNTNIKKFVVYDLFVRLDRMHNTDQNPVKIERRYTDFHQLYTNLRKEFSQHFTNIYFPKKVLMGNFSSDLIIDRGAAFEALLQHIVSVSELRDSKHFLNFIQGIELTRACQYLDERRNEMAVPILEKCFRLLNKIYMDRAKPVLLLLCRLVAACTTSPVPHPLADKWAELALRRYEGVSDTELLILYIPLLHTCTHLWWQKGRDKKLITKRLNDMAKRGINISDGPTLTKAIHSIDPRAETN